MTLTIKPFHERQIRKPLPGALADDEGLYIAMRELEGLKPTSLYEYHRELDRLATMFPDKTAADFTVGDIQTYLARRTMMPDPETGKRLSQNSRRKVILVLNNFFRWAVMSGRCPAGNPMLTIKAPTFKFREPTAWTPQEMDRILQAPATQPHDSLLLSVLAYCGQRVGATARLQWKQVQGLGTRDCVIRFPPSKGDELHTVPVMKRELHEKLVLMRELTQPQADDWLFRSRQGGYLALNQITRIVEHACRHAQAPKPWTAHQFRRSLITNLLEAGQELTVVSKVVANHKSPQTTMLHYRSVPGATAKAAFSATPW